MPQINTLLILGGIVALALASSQSAASVPRNEYITDPALIPPFPDQLPDVGANPNSTTSVTSRLVAFLATIRKFESNDDYSILYGGNHFLGFDKYPRINKRNSAAGAYQITAATYDDFAPRLGITDFTPNSQDRIAVALLQNTGAYDAIVSGDIETAFMLASRRWASLPGSTAGQNPVALSTAMDTFNRFV